jgi:hypothetical protein
MKDNRSLPPGVVMGIEPVWIEGPDGVRHELGQAHRRIISALTRLHRHAPGRALTIQELLEAGWPGERPISPAGTNRVHVVLAQLRRIGMRGVIERYKDGYRIAPSANVTVAS